MMSAVESPQLLTPMRMKLMEHESGVERGVAEVGWHLKQIRDERLYREDFPNFETYCQARWGFGRSYVNKQIAAAESIAAIEAALPSLGTNVPNPPLPARESQVRPLTGLPAEEAAEVWIEAVERSDGQQPTAATVAEVVKERTAVLTEDSAVTEDDEDEDEDASAFGSEPADDPIVDEVAEAPVRTPLAVPKPAPKVNGERVEGAPPHPAVYSDAVLVAFRELIRDHHEHSDMDGDGALVIVDPFAGTGRIHELQADGWRTIGVELEAEWANLHPDTIHGDSRRLLDVIDVEVCDTADVIATSPAYGNRLADAHYNASDPQARRSYALDLGRPLTEGSGAGLQWGTEYRSLHETVWGQCVDLLAPGGLFLLNCKDHQRDGEIIDVTWWHVRALIDLGLVVIDGRTIPPAGLAMTTAAKLPELVIALRKPEER